MTATAESPVDYIEVTRSTYRALGFPEYRWVHSEPPIPWTEPRKPLAHKKGPAGAGPVPWVRPTWARVSGQLAQGRPPCAGLPRIEAAITIIKLVITVRLVV